MAAVLAQATDHSQLSTDERETDALALGELDITTEKLSLAGIEKEIEAFADSEVLRAILDQGGQQGSCFPVGTGSRQLGSAAAKHTTGSSWCWEVVALAGWCRSRCRHCEELLGAILCSQQAASSPRPPHLAQCMRPTWMH